MDNQQEWFKEDNTCNYSTEWQPYTGDYDKFEYDIRLKDGRVRTNCYPNAGMFNSIDPSLKNGADKLVSEIRFTPKDQQKYGINPDAMYL